MDESTTIIVVVVVLILLLLFCCGGFGGYYYYKKTRKNRKNKTRRPHRRVLPIVARLPGQRPPAPSADNPQKKQLLPKKPTPAASAPSPASAPLQRPAKNHQPSFFERLKSFFTRQHHQSPGIPKQTVAPVAAPQEREVQKPKEKQKKKKKSKREDSYPLQEII